jgi:hypothetical protein
MRRREFITVLGGVWWRQGGPAGIRSNNAGTNPQLERSIGDGVQQSFYILALIAQGQAHGYSGGLCFQRER